MWIKASGTLLKDALKKNLFVEVDASGIAHAVRSGSVRADQPQEFLRKGDNRPSIETCLHAILPEKFVVHVHCVNTIAGAIRHDARDYFAQRLAAFDWAFVPYAKPGAALAAQVLAAAPEPKKIYVLANHGLLISANTIEEVRHSLASAVKAESAEIPEPPPKPEKLSNWVCHLFDRTRISPPAFCR